MVRVVDGPGAVVREDHVPVPLADGTTLGARIWLPEGARDDPVPAILEYIPYRKNDLFAVNDEGRFAYFAARGYAGVRLDIRGSGDSEGVLLDEYAQQEQDDGLEAIEWIASQPWCSGNVGMIGKSWGGFNGLQVAARRPPQLKAVVSVYSTDDRYADDAHYMGGCLLTDEMLGWGNNMHTVATLPPDPRSVGSAWRAMWKERLDSFHPQIDTWLKHQRRDAYWRHGSVCENFDDISCAVFAVGGWCDGYRDAVLRLMEGLSCPKKGLIGPWSHQYAMEAFEPGPHIGFLQECIRFFDFFLRGIDNGIMDEPTIRVFMQDPVRPARSHPERPGRWAAEPSWPSPNISALRLYLNDGALGEAAQPGRSLCISGSELAGLDAGSWCAFGGPLDAPPDQRVEDGLSLSFTSEPLEAPIEILGNPVAGLVLSSDRERALVVVRLCVVFEDGQSLLLTRGMLNLTHRESHESPEPLPPDEKVAARVELQAVGEVVPAGHRLRVSISPTYYPWAWPSPEPVTLTIHTGESSIELPVRGESPLDAGLRAFDPPEIAPKRPFEVVGQSPGEHTMSRDLVTRRTEVVDRSGSRTVRLADGLEMAETRGSGFGITEGEPLSASFWVEHFVSFKRGDWDVSLNARSELSSDRDRFHLRATLGAFDGAEPLYEREWKLQIERDLA